MNHIILRKVKIVIIVIGIILLSASSKTVFSSSSPNAFSGSESDYESYQKELEELQSLKSTGDMIAFEQEIDRVFQSNSNVNVNVRKAIADNLPEILGTGVSKAAVANIAEKMRSWTEETSSESLKLQAQSTRSAQASLSSETAHLSDLKDSLKKVYQEVNYLASDNSSDAIDKILSTLNERDPKFISPQAIVSALRKIPDSYDDETAHSKSDEIQKALNGVKKDFADYAEVMDCLVDVQQEIAFISKCYSQSNKDRAKVDYLLLTTSTNQRNKFDGYNRLMNKYPGNNYLPTMKDILASVTPKDGNLFEQAVSENELVLPSARITGIEPLRPYYPGASVLFTGTVFATSSDVSIDKLTFIWTVTDVHGNPLKSPIKPQAGLKTRFTFAKPGEYLVNFYVTEPKDGKVLCSLSAFTFISVLEKPE